MKGHITIRSHSCLVLSCLVLSCLGSSGRERERESGRVKESENAMWSFVFSALHGHLEVMSMYCMSSSYPSHLNMEGVFEVCRLKVKSGHPRPNTGLLPNLWGMGK